MKTIFVIFGATGDLAKRKLFPALYNIYLNGKNDDLDIISIGRRNLNDEQFRDYLEQETNDFINKKPYFLNFLEKIKYLKLELDNRKDYISLKNYLDENNDENTQIIFYLAISPEYFHAFIDNYKNIRFDKIKVVFEKPFGTDLKTARELNSKIMEVFNEDDVYRIDHYVGKEAVQNIFAFRFTNTIYEAIWNNKYIDNIQITASEDIGVLDRGGYYDRFGALRDMLQNHLFQVLSFITMEIPSKMDAPGIREEKLKVFKNINLLSDFEDKIIFGQYNGYLKEKGVKENSRTETFVAMKIEVNNPNFVGVPIYLRTGKYMSKKNTQIVIEFKEVPLILLEKYGKIEKNRIIIEVQPNESIEINFNIKQNGNSKEVERVKSKFIKEVGSKEAYHKLLEDIIAGDKTLFTSWDMLEESWRIVDKLVNCELNCPILYTYDKGTDGPEITGKLLENDGRKYYI